MQWLSRPYAPTDCAAECECGTDTDTNGISEPLRRSQFVPHGQLLAKRESFTNSGPLGNADAVARRICGAHAKSDAESDTDAESNTDTDADSDANTNADFNTDADAESDTNAGRDRALDKRGATRDRWIDDESSRERVAV